VREAIGPMPHGSRCYTRIRYALMAPLDWNELTAKLSPQKFHLRNALLRFKKRHDLFGEVLSNKQALEVALNI